MIYIRNLDTMNISGDWPSCEAIRQAYLNAEKEALQINENANICEAGGIAVAKLFDLPTFPIDSALIVYLYACERLNNKPDESALTNMKQTLLLDFNIVWLERNNHEKAHCWYV